MNLSDEQCAKEILTENRSQTNVSNNLGTGLNMNDTIAQWIQDISS